MEKSSPHYDLESIQTEMSEIEYLRRTASATQGADALGIDDYGVVAVIQTMRRSMIVKSMTSNREGDGEAAIHYDLYVKFTMRDGKPLLISFKEDEN